MESGSAPTSGHNAGTETIPEPKRKRLAQACDTCRRKKIKCDGGRPKCANCQKGSRECVYNPNVRKRGPRQGYIEMLEKRLDKMERLLSSEVRQSLLTNAPPCSSSSNETETTAITAKSPVLVSNSSAGGSIGSLGNDQSVINKARHEHNHHHPQSFGTERTMPVYSGSVVSPISYPPSETGTSSSSSTLAYLPAKRNAASCGFPPADVVEHLLDLYFRHIYPFASIIDRDMLMNDIRENKCSEFLLLCIMAASARFSDRPDIREEPPWHSGEKYAVKAREMLLTVIDTPSLVHVQGLMMLCMHEFGCARGPRTWMLSGMAARMVLELGLHKEPDLEYDSGKAQTADEWRKRELQRRVFWCIFSLDKFTSASTGRPAMLQEEDCDVLLPCDEDGWSKGHCYTQNAEQSRTALFSVQALQGSNLLGVSTSIDPNHIVADTMGAQRQLGFLGQIHRVICLLGKVTAYINRRGKKGEMSALYGPDSEFSRLDRLIDEWHESLPSSMRNTAANFNRYKETNLRDCLRYVLMHALYNTVVVLLHRPSLVLGETLNLDVVQPQLKQIINYSAEKCMTAVDNVSAMLRQIKNDTTIVPPFMTYLTYTVATIAVNNAFFGKPDESAKAREALKEHFSLLQAMRSRWAMADKLYFMIRDLYAMHVKLLKQQKVALQNKQQQEEQEGQHHSSSPSNTSTIMTQQDMSFWQPPSSSQPPVNSSSSQACANAAAASAIQPVEQQFPYQPLSGAADQMSAAMGAYNMSLADLSGTTCDGISCTNWILGDNSENIAASIQLFGRQPATTTMNTQFSMFEVPATDIGSFPESSWVYDVSNFRPNTSQ